MEAFLALDFPLGLKVQTAWWVGLHCFFPTEEIEELGTPSFGEALALGTVALLGAFGLALARCSSSWTSSSRWTSRPILSSFFAHFEQYFCRWCLKLTVWYFPQMSHLISHGSCWGMVKSS